MASGGMAHAPAALRGAMRCSTAATAFRPPAPMRALASAIRTARPVHRLVLANDGCRKGSSGLRQSSSYGGRARSRNSRPDITSFSSAGPAPVLGTAPETSSTDAAVGGAEEEQLSARERRRRRNERREEAKAAERPWREEVEEKMVERMTKGRRRRGGGSGWQAEADINLCVAKGVQWWMLQTTRRFEREVADQIGIAVRQDFPGREVEVLVPTMPVRSRLKDGNASEARKKVYEGIVLVRCVMDRELHAAVKRIPRAFEFNGNWVGFSGQPMIMPAPVSELKMERLLEKIRVADAEHEEFRAQCERETAAEAEAAKVAAAAKGERKGEEAMATATATATATAGLALEVGAAVRLLAGPFVDFAGTVVELVPESEQVRVVVVVFGNETEVLMDAKDVVIEAAA